MLAYFSEICSQNKRNAMSLIMVCDARGVQEAAAVTLSYTVAYLLVHDLANITSNRTVLLHSAGGAVVSAKNQLPCYG